MIYITGDIHGDPKRLSKKNFPQAQNMTKDDYIIILGDFGVIWTEQFLSQEKYWLDWLDERPFTTLFIDGNHEGYERLNSFPVETWNGGLVHKVRPSVIHLMRGQVFNIEGKTFFTFGGAQSHDISGGILDRSDPDFKIKKKRLDKDPYASYRILNESWWKEELPSKEEIEIGRNTIKNVKHVDYVLTHTLPYSIHKKLDMTEKSNDLSIFLDEVNETLDFNKWFCGHLHVNRWLNDKFKIFYEDLDCLPNLERNKDIGAER